MTDDDPIWTQAELAAFAQSSDEDVREWALERLHLHEPETAARLGRALRVAPTPGPDDPEIDRLAAAREELRARGKALLADGDTRAVALFALERQRDRWAASLLLEELDRIRGTDEFSLVWQVLANLGDLRALDAGIERHRPGERRLATQLVFLHRLAGKTAATPVAVAEDAGRRGPAYRLRVPLRCLGCRTCGEYDGGSAVIHPDIPKCLREGWDGVLFSRIITCKWCGAEDEYELTTLAKAILVLAREDYERARAQGRSDETGIVVGEARMWDGTQCRRPSQSLAHLRAIAARDPKRGEGWRRVGNFSERIGRLDDARAAWKEAARVDPGELEAVFSIAKDHDEHDLHELASRSVDDFLERFARNPERRAGARGALVGILELVRRNLPPRKLGLYAMWEDGHAPDGGPIIRKSGIDLASVTSTEALADFLIRPSVIAAGLAKDVPRDRPTQLEVALGAVHGALRAPAVPMRSALGKVGRNALCPCGSGKKNKRCCSAQ